MRVSEAIKIGFVMLIFVWMGLLLYVGSEGVERLVLRMSNPTIHAQSSPRFDSLRPIESVAGFGVLELRDTVTDSCYIVVTYGSDVTITDAQPCGGDFRDFRR